MLHCKHKYNKIKSHNISELGSALHSATGGKGHQSVFIHLTHSSNKRIMGDIQVSLLKYVVKVPNDFIS